MTDFPDAVTALGIANTSDVTVRGRTVRLHVGDPDAALRTLYASRIAFSDVTVRGGDLDEAFTALIHSQEP